MRPLCIRHGCAVHVSPYCCLQHGKGKNLYQARVVMYGYVVTAATDYASPHPSPIRKMSGRDTTGLPSKRLQESNQSIQIVNVRTN